MTDQVENQAAEPVQLSLADIQTFVSIIDICSKRGAFEGAELESVGALRGKTVKFLEASQPAAEDAPEAEAEEESSDES
jgi:hypothetical protein